MNGYNMHGGVNMTNDNKSKRIVSVEFDERDYNELNELVDHLQSQSISTVTKQDAIKFFVKYVYRQLVLKEDRK
jgi:hypothetical protein